MTDVVEATGEYLILERISSSPVGLPSYAGIGPGWQMRMRLVWEYRAKADVFFAGAKLNHDVGAIEWIADLILPGQQITTRRTGEKELVLMYCGKLNIVSGPPGLSQYRTSFKSPTAYGADPIPDVQLYGRDGIKFISDSGIEDPTSLAIFVKATGRLTPIETSSKAALIAQLNAATASTPGER